MKHQTVSVTEFKAKCLALLDEIHREGGTLTVTKRGQPLATVGPAKRKPFKSSANILSGKCKIVGDIINMDDCELWQWDCMNGSDDGEKAPSRRKK
jgi:antitoxin (DNA-binding transcriptional repressor) of toxin-antitoxin stability system